jgi:ElaB/YqjD/DUF883 family membrane-anchored ribosome-binding protein
MKDANLNRKVCEPFHGVKDFMEPTISAEGTTANHVKIQRTSSMDGATHSAAERMHKAADNLRERNCKSNAVANRLAGKAASAMDQAASYIDEFSAQRLRNDISELVRKHPLQSMAVGALCGFFAARLWRR